MTHPSARTIIATGLACIGALAAACGGGFSEAEPTGSIFAGPPWDDHELLSYDFKQRTHLYGTCELETRVNGAGGTTEFLHRCVDADEGLYRDDRSVLVESATLRPLRSERTIVGEDDGDVETKSAAYSDDGSVARFLSVSGEDEYSATRDLPQPSEDIAEPVWYDDNSLFWLARGLDFEDDATFEFTNVNLSTVTVFNVELTVEGTEMVEVPAGTFEAWKLTVKTETVTQRVWVAVAEPHVMVQADIRNGRYELTAIE